MHLLNIDLHISVIRDIKHILEQICPDVVVDDSRSWSGHGHLVGKSMWHSRHINSSNWKQAFSESSVIKEFIITYRKLFDQYDGFIVTHAPVLCQVFEATGKPVLCINSCRWDQPFCFNQFDAGRNQLVQCLKRMAGKDTIRLISNNEGDAGYLYSMTNISTPVIPSLCTYTDVIWDHTRIDQKVILYVR